MRIILCHQVTALDGAMWLGRLWRLHRVHCSTLVSTNGRVRAPLCYQITALGGAMWLGRLSRLRRVLHPAAVTLDIAAIA